MQPLGSVVIKSQRPQLLLYLWLKNCKGKTVSTSGFLFIAVTSAPFPCSHSSILTDTHRHSLRLSLCLPRDVSVVFLDSVISHLTLSETPPSVNQLTCSPAPQLKSKVSYKILSTRTPAYVCLYQLHVHQLPAWKLISCRRRPAVGWFCLFAWFKPAQPAANCSF